jgi:hypothetical protein
MQNFKSENKNNNKDVKDAKVRNEEALTRIRAKMTAKVNEVKTIEKTLTGFRIDLEKQFNRKIGSDPAITLPPHFATMFNIPVLIYISIIFTIFIFKNFISISNAVVSDPLDHHFQTFTIGDLSDCKRLCLSRQTASVLSRNLSKSPWQTLTPYDFSKFLKPGLIYVTETYLGTLLFQTTYSQVEPGNLKPIFTMTHSYPTT